MATGEGKTLVATLPLYLNALPGKGAHLVTVNSYLARRDSQWMGHVYRYPGPDGRLPRRHRAGTPERRAAYGCDITYGTNNEYGFDYLRDNMVSTLEQRVQRGHVFAIVDEVDSVLIDEARTPLIISGPVGNESDAQYAEHNAAVARLVRRQTEFVNQLVGRGRAGAAEGDEPTDAALPLYKAQTGRPQEQAAAQSHAGDGRQGSRPEDGARPHRGPEAPGAKQTLRDIEDDLLYVLDEKGHTVHLTDQGVDFLSPGGPRRVRPPRHLGGGSPDRSRRDALAAREAGGAARDREPTTRGRARSSTSSTSCCGRTRCTSATSNYVVQDGPGHDRRRVHGPRHAGPALVGRPAPGGRGQGGRSDRSARRDAYATITIQNYFRMYEKLAGMTGTAETEATEFIDIYRLDGAGHPDQQAVHPGRQERLDLQGAPRQVQRDPRGDRAATREGPARARGHDERRGLRGPLAGCSGGRGSSTPCSTPSSTSGGRDREPGGPRGAVTIATNMAGRGTDIKLGEWSSACEGRGRRRREAAAST